MTTPAAASYISDNARTEAEVKQWFEDILAITKELPGGIAESTLTLAAGVVTPTAAMHKVDTEGAASADDLATLATTNHPEGRVILLRAVDAGRVVTVKHNAGGAGQIALLSAADLNLNTAQWLMLKRTGTDWEQVMYGPGETPSHLQGAVADVSGYVKGQTTFIEADNGGLASPLYGPLTLPTSYESIGPTGGGATNTWTALDAVPAGAKAVMVKLYATLTVTQTASGGCAGTLNFFAAKNGITPGVTTAEKIGTLVAGGSVGAGQSYSDYQFFNSIVIPLDSSRRFQLRTVESLANCTSSKTMSMALVGFVM